MAAQSLSEYESLYGINIRNRLELDGNISESSEKSQDFQNLHTTNQNGLSNHLIQSDRQNSDNSQLLGEKRVERLPVSMASDLTVNATY